MERCPICNAKLDIILHGYGCNRCKADLSLLFNLHAQSITYLKLTIITMLNDVNLEIDVLLEKANLYHNTKLGKMLQAFNKYKSNQEGSITEV